MVGWQTIFERVQRGRRNRNVRMISMERRRTCWRNERKRTNLNRNVRMISMERRPTRGRKGKKRT